MSYIKILVGALLIALVGACSSAMENQTFESQMERAIGKESFSFIKRADKVSVMQVSREDKDSYQIVSEERVLTPQQAAHVKNLLLSDSSYHFEKRKKCIFVPEYAYKFQNKDKTIVVLISFSCPQVKLLLNQHAVIIDNDPIAAEFQVYTNQIRGGK